MSWIIQLRDPKDGARYFSSHGKGVTTDLSKVKIFSDKNEAENKMEECTLWEDRKLILV